MIYMGFNNALIKWKRIIIDSLGMAAIMVIMVLIISSYYKESGMYIPYVFLDFLCSSCINYSHNVFIWGLHK